jgi:hypothetical protein
VIDVALPAADLVEKGVDDLRRGVESAAALLVSMAPGRLAEAGVDVPPPLPNPEVRLYGLLRDQYGDDAHGRYNVLVRRLVSFARVDRRQALDRARIGAVLQALGNEARTPARLYLAGGGTAVLVGWRDATVDVDIKLVPSDHPVMRAIPKIKETLGVGITLTSPELFIPVLPGWEDRSPFVDQYGPLTCFHFDPAAQALAKIERGMARDLDDVRAMLDRGLVTPDLLMRTFEGVEPDLYRFPAIDPSAFRRRLDRILAESPE